MPILVHTTPGNIRDDMPLIAMLEALPVIDGPDNSGRTWPRLPIALVGDRGYGFKWIIEAVERMGILSMLDPRGSRHGSGLGTVRYVVERTLGWFGYWRRIKHCYEKTGAHWQAFNELAACMICYRKLRRIKEGI